MSLQQPSGKWDKNGRDPEPKGAEFPTRLVALAVLAVCAVVFLLQNRQRVKTHFLFFAVTSRHWVSLAVALVLGALIGQLIERWWRKRRDNKD